MALITQIPKNAREEFRISRDDFRGHDMINIRVFFVTEEGEMRPGRQGVAFKAELLPEFMRALAQAEAA